MSEDDVVSDEVRRHTEQWGIDTPLMKYLRGLQYGERVQETDKTSCLRGRQGTVYLNAGGGHCVL